MHRTDPAAERLGRHDPADPPPGHGVGLRQRADRDGPVLEPGHRARRHVAEPVVRDVLVDLVGEHDRVPALAQLGDHLELVAREHLAGRVVRRVDHDAARARVERGRELTLVERPVRRRERHGPRHGAREDRVGPVVLVERLEHDDLVAGVEHAEHRGDHRLGRAARDRHVAFGLDPRHAVARSVRVGDRGSERLGAPGDRVLVDVVGDRLASRLLDLLGRGEVGEALRQVDGAVRDREPRHLADHGFGERGGLARRADLRHPAMIAAPSSRPRRAVRLASVACAPKATRRTAASRSAARCPTGCGSSDRRPTSDRGGGSRSTRRPTRTWQPAWRAGCACRTAPPTA